MRVKIVIRNGNCLDPGSGVFTETGERLAVRAVEFLGPIVASGDPVSVRLTMDDPEIDIEGEAI